jgi:rare lipoprotein A
LPIETATTAVATPLPPVASAHAPASTAVPPTAVAPAGTQVAESPAPPVAATEGGFVVQLAAFASNANADNFVARLAPSIASVGVEPKVRQVNGLFRVFVGPYPSRDDAKRIAVDAGCAGASSTIAIH